MKIICFPSMFKFIDQWFPLVTWFLMKTIDFPSVLVLYCLVYIYIYIYAYIYTYMSLHIDLGGLYWRPKPRGCSITMSLL